VFPSSLSVIESIAIYRLKLSEQEALGFWSADQCCLEESPLSAGIPLHYLGLAASTRQTRRRLTEWKWHLLPWYACIKAVTGEGSSPFDATPLPRRIELLDCNYENRREGMQLEDKALPTTSSQLSNASVLVGR
jgi:hypothetical protein